jgi:predicted DNA-binding transcriptional regulator AlpA
MTAEPNTTGRDWIGRQEVARMCGVHSWTVDKWARDRKGPPFYQMAGARKYDRAEVEAWIKARRREGAQ